MILTEYQDNFPQKGSAEGSTASRIQSRVWTSSLQPRSQNGPLDCPALACRARCRIGRSTSQRRLEDVICRRMLQLLQLPCQCLILCRTHVGTRQAPVIVILATSTPARPELDKLPLLRWWDECLWRRNSQIAIWHHWIDRRSGRAGQ